MRLSPPKVVSWYLGLILGLAGLAGKLGYFAQAAPHAFWLVSAGLALLLLATLLKQL